MADHSVGQALLGRSGRGRAIEDDCTALLRKPRGDQGLNEQIAETQGRLDAMRGDMPRRADGDIASPYSDFSPMAASVLRAREASIDDLDRNLAMLRSQLRKANAEYRVQADTMLGLREGETKTMARNAVEASSRAVVDGLFTSTAKVLGVGEGYLFGPMWEAMTGQRYETARDSYLYALGEEIEEQAKSSSLAMLRDRRTTRRRLPTAPAR